jgi:signal transduction histidine kinase
LDNNGDLKYFVGIERDITKLKEIDRMKTEFISLASHQLRTPLAAIKWSLDLLMTGKMGEVPENQMRVLNILYEGAERMNVLIKNLLNISRIESGRILVEPVPTKLNDLVDKVLSEQKPKSDQKSIKINSFFDNDLPEISIDPKLITEVYANIISNAIKYTPEKGVITISIYKKDNKIFTEVKDTGIGIPLSQQDKMFQKFFRADNAVLTEADGNGLGMYLAKSIINSSGGDIWFESTEGKGTTFWFSLPV